MPAPAVTEGDEPLDAASARILLRDAMPTRGDVERDGAEEVEARRAAAVRRLLAHVRALRAEDSDPATLQPVDAEIIGFFSRAWPGILTARDPVAELACFLGSGKGRRGPKPDPDAALELARAVAQKRADGMGYDDALWAVADASGKSFERVKGVYSQHMRQARVDVALSRMEATPGADAAIDRWLRFPAHLPATTDDHRASDDGMPGAPEE